MKTQTVANTNARLSMEPKSASTLKHYLNVNLDMAMMYMLLNFVEYKLFNLSLDL